jgi:diguanylate cyclase (GGDEF)-like protein
VYRPEWDDFIVATAAGSQEMRDTLLGETYDREVFLRETLDERFARRGAYYIPDGELDWAITSGARYVPDLPVRDDPDAWHAGDEFFVPCRDSDGLVLAVLSLAEPLSGRRPTNDEIDFVVTVANHAARALEHAQRTQEAARHRAVLEQLLAVSSMFAAGQRSIEAILQSVCGGVQRALGFQKVTIELIDPDSGFLVPRAAAGWPPGEEPRWRISPGATGRLMDPAFEVGGCFLLPQEIGRRLSPSEYGELRSSMNGRGPFAWNRHWLFVPLYAQDGSLLGRLEALAVFANQATMAIVAAGQLEQLRTLAEQDPLTGLLNRRTFMNELEQEVERARRYDRSLALVLCDLDHFKSLNDTHGHPTGDEALRRLAEVLSTCLRAGDSAFRIGGDEFALLLPEADEAEAEAAAERLAGAFRVAADPAFAGLGMTFGVATVPDDANESEALIRRADAALYERKRARPTTSAITLRGL